MVRRILILLNLIFIFRICSAPPPSENLTQQYTQFAISEMKRWAYDREFVRFANFLQAKESGGDWTIINQIGCVGLFQFSPRTLEWLGYGYITTDRFRHDPDIFPPELQLKILKEFTRSNENELKDYLCFVGEIINGVTITKSGLLAGAHLAGCSGVKLYLNTRGAVNNKDINHTSVQDYIRGFAGFEI